MIGIYIYIYMSDAEKKSLIACEGEIGTDMSELKKCGSPLSINSIESFKFAILLAILDNWHDFHANNVDISNLLNDVTFPYNKLASGSDARKELDFCAKSTDTSTGQPVSIWKRCKMSYISNEDNALNYFGLVKVLNIIGSGANVKRFGVVVPNPTGGGYAHSKGYRALLYAAPVGAAAPRLQNVTGNGPITQMLEKIGTKELHLVVDTIKSTALNEIKRILKSNWEGRDRLKYLVCGPTEYDPATKMSPATDGGKELLRAYGEARNNSGWTQLIAQYNRLPGIAQVSAAVAVAIPKVKNKFLKLAEQQWKKNNNFIDFGPFKRIFITGSIKVPSYWENDQQNIKLRNPTPGAMSGGAAPVWTAFANKIIEPSDKQDNPFVLFGSGREFNIHYPNTSIVANATIIPKNGAGSATIYLADKTFAQKSSWVKDIMNTVFKNIKNWFKSNISLLAWLGPGGNNTTYAANMIKNIKSAQKNKAEHYLCKRLGDAIQFLYLLGFFGNSTASGNVVRMGVTYDRTAAVFGLL